MKHPAYKNCAKVSAHINATVAENKQIFTTCTKSV